MSNPYYSHNGYPQNSADANAVDVRAELLAIQAGFDKLCALLGQSEKLVLVNQAETGLTTAEGKFLLNASWVPVISCATPGDLTIVLSEQVGIIHRVGKLILLQWALTTSTFTHTTASGAIKITGVPIISSNQGAFPLAMSFQGITKANYTQFAPVIGTSANTIAIEASGSAQAKASLNITDMPTGGSVILRGSLAYYGQS